MKSVEHAYKNVNVLWDFDEQPILTINSFPPFKHTVTEKYYSIVPEWFSSVNVMGMFGDTWGSNKQCLFTNNDYQWTK